MKTVAIIVAAGYGKRMGKSKQFLLMGGKPVLEWTLSVFEDTEMVDEIILVVNPEDVPRAKKFNFSKLKQVIGGGKERQDSVNNALKVLPQDAQMVVIHDGVRPFVTPEIIEKAVEEAKEFGAVVVGVPVKDTIKQRTNEGSTILRTIDREGLWQAQTPQVFRKEVILKAFKEGYNKYQVTDDATLVEKLGLPVKMVLGAYRNIKITTPEDLMVAEEFIKKGA